MAGYSGTPLASKLGIKPGAKVFVANAPKAYRGLVRPLPEGVTLLARLSPGVDLVHIFSTSKAYLDKTLRASLPKIHRDGAIWVSWPKKSSNVATDVTEHTIREIALPLGLVDVKVCAVDHTWSGLKLVIRKALRGSGGEASVRRRARPARR